MKKILLASVLISTILLLPLISSAEETATLYENDENSVKQPYKIEFYDQNDDKDIHFEHFDVHGLQMDNQTIAFVEEQDNPTSFLEEIDQINSETGLDNLPFDEPITTDCHNEISNPESDQAEKTEQPPEATDEQNTPNETTTPTRIEFVDTESSEIKSGEATPTDLQPTYPPQSAKSKEEFGVIYGDTLIKLGDDPEFAIEEMENLETEELEVNEDRVTTYTPKYKSYETKNLAVMTNTENEQETIKAIFIDIKGVKTKRGIEVGDPVSKVYKKYGRNYKHVMDTIIYKIRSKSETHYLLFQIDDDDTILSYAILDELPAVYKKFY